MTNYASLAQRAGQRQIGWSELVNMSVLAPHDLGWHLNWIRKLIQNGESNNYITTQLKQFMPDQEYSGDPRHQSSNVLVQVEKIM